MGCQPCRPTVIDEDFGKTLVVPRGSHPFEKTVDRFSSTNPFGIETGESLECFFSAFHHVLECSPATVIIVLHSLRKSELSQKKKLITKKSVRNLSPPCCIS
ncbi:hypothetical protein CRE_30856 [Caenorhabditis remanei]|uniref:Uncharacterized protein n=1 Tax=Caenorhabditis remanei TaxID=31234 RepID=E3LUN3_CAERE|nr:hypothetical protein CRE_30856 [Caenorhabditis remanei]